MVEVDKLDLTIDEINFIVDGYKNKVAAACKEYIDSKEKDIRKLKVEVEDCFAGLEEFDEIIRKAQINIDEDTIIISGDSGITYFAGGRWQVRDKNDSLIDLLLI